MRLLASVILALLVLAAPAHASTLVTLDAPSSFVDPAGDVGFNSGSALKVNVLLPDGYDPHRAYPLVMLLHGVGDNYAGWAQKGDVQRAAAGLQAIVAMPEGGHGFYTNWWNGGARGGPSWESYELETVLPLIRHRYKIRPERRYHAFMGVSMGGLGAAYLGGRLPGYFGTVVVISGYVDHQRPEDTDGGMKAIAGVSYQQVWGPGDGFYATGHNPTRLTDNLATMHVLVTTGDGIPEADDVQSPSDRAVAAAAEGVVIRPMVDAFVAALDKSGVDYTFVPHHGTHAWQYFSRDVTTAVRWGLFKPVDQHPSHWVNRTVADHGDLFGIRYEFDDPPDGVVRFQFDEGRLAAAGTSGGVTLVTARGCWLHKTLPFDAKLPARNCRKRGHTR